jgi:redox-sensitive bicupin YhaK (pirin superfamily)
MPWALGREPESNVISYRKAAERRHRKRGGQESWLTFLPESRRDPLAAGFATFRNLNERRYPPRTGAQERPSQAGEVVTYVLEGAIRSEDSTGRSGIIRAGGFQRRAVRAGFRRRETNTSRTTWARVLQVRLDASTGVLESTPEQKRFSAAERRGRLCLVASPDASAGSLRLDQDVLVYSALLAPGQHMLYQIPRGRNAWLHLLEGAASLTGVSLAAGDGAGLRGERVLSLTAQDATELLLVVVG